MADLPDCKDNYFQRKSPNTPLTYIKCGSTSKSPISHTPTVSLRRYSIWRPLVDVVKSALLIIADRTTFRKVVLAEVDKFHEDHVEEGILAHYGAEQKLFGCQRKLLMSLLCSWFGTLKGATPLVSFRTL
jgi:hypothetical protein